MKKLALLLILYLPYSISVLAQHPLEEVLFNQIDQILVASDNLIVVQNKGDYLVKIWDTESNSTIHEIVRNGRGPGELNRPVAASIDLKSNSFYIVGSDRRLLKYSLSGEILSDRLFENLPTAFSNSGSQDLYLKDRYIILSTELSLPVDQLNERAVPLAAMVDTLSGERVFTWELDAELIGFDDTDEIMKANTVPIRSSLLMINERLSVITISGLPYFYCFINGVFRERIEIESDFDVHFAASNRSEFGSSTGLRVPANLNSIQQIGNDHLLISYGNIHQEEIPQGYSLYRIEHEAKSGLQDEISIKRVLNKELEPEDDVSAFELTYHNGKLYLNHQFDWMGHQVFVRDASEIAEFVE